MNGFKKIINFGLLMELLTPVLRKKLARRSVKSGRSKFTGRQIKTRVIPEFKLLNIHEYVEFLLYLGQVGGALEWTVA